VRWRDGRGKEEMGGLYNYWMFGTGGKAGTEGQTARQVDGERVGYLAGVCTALHCAAFGTSDSSSQSCANHILKHDRRKGWM